ncbi:MAG: undecaprenyldiphospho-muramoylpentapeptide beta-N-acetylglucosaminyltransferase [Erysipelotrichaceae bacterium]|nr:undecaprenyldiphospho-muramoylpentapeptide beta-N-acetylglucosaminyltransferase [Erysipelotrichaceae bacterium]
MKIAIAAGGTGGHIYPALTLAEALKDRGHEIVFFGSYDRMEKDIIPKTEFEFIPLDVVSTQGGYINKIRSVLSIFKAYFRCKKLLKGFDMVIGFGNYISIPVVLAGRSLGQKTVIHEQNSFAGKANKFLDKKVDLVIGSYKEDSAQFKNPHTLILGNPQSYRALRIKKDDDTLRKLGLDPDKKTVVIFMGSLGSETVNKILLDYFTLLDGSYQVVYATGKEYYEKDREAVEEKDYLKIFERIDGIRVMRSSDLLVSRAGATTLCEIISLGMPSILIPSPYVPNNHQYYNAKSLVDEGAALMIEEKDLTASSLNEAVNSIINDEEKLTELSKNARKLANDSVIEDIVREIENL